MSINAPNASIVTGSEVELGIWQKYIFHIIDGMTGLDFPKQIVWEVNWKPTVTVEKYTDWCEMLNNIHKLDSKQKNPTFSLQMWIFKIFKQNIKNAKLLGTWMKKTYF